MRAAAHAGTPPADLRAAVRDFAAAQPTRPDGAVRLEVVERDGRPVVAGRVLTHKQAREVREIARRQGAEVELVVVADPGSGLEHGWARPAVDVLDVWRDPARAGEEAARQTQYLVTDDASLRRLGEDGGFVLVQGPDLAIGWARADELREDDPSRGRAAWAAVVRAEDGESRAPEPSGTTAAAVVERARAALGLPYLWGGRGGGGYDCSGLVQRAFEPAGVLLPRHTGDQRRVGARVVPGEARAGDLLFARPNTQRVGHVLLMTSPSTVLHACRTWRKVVEESLADNQARYVHQGWRRPVRFAE